MRERARSVLTLIPWYEALVTTESMLIDAVNGFPSVIVAEATPVVPMSSGNARFAWVTRFCSRGGIVVASLIAERASFSESIGVVAELPMMRVSLGTPFRSRIGSAE